MAIRIFWPAERITVCLYSEYEAADTTTAETTDTTPATTTDNTSDHIILTTDITYESRTVTSGSNKVSSSNTGERSFIPLWITIACSAVAIIGTLIFMKIRKKSE